MKHLWAEIRSLPPADRKALVQFGLLVGGVFVGVALVIWWRAEWLAGVAVWVLGIAGVLLVLLGAAAPRALRPVHRVWMSLAIVLGFVMTNVLLTLVFAVAVTPIGLILRLFGKDPMQRRTDSKAASYWEPKPPPDPDPARFERYY